MAIVNGKVDGVSTKYAGKYGIFVNGKWYNSQEQYLKFKPQKGDVIEFDDGGRNYINNLKSIDGGVAEPVDRYADGSKHSSPAPKPAYSAPGGRTFPVGVTAPERTINRQSALRDAVTVVTNYDFPIHEIGNEVIKMARLFEAYTTGDLDLEEAKKALDEMGA